MSYTFKDLKQDVAAEAKALREHATKEELKNLNFYDFNKWGRSSCIYGLATGDCHSERAAILINKCALRFFVNKHFTQIMYEGFEGVARRVNGKRVKNFILERSADNMDEKHFSAIEAYILLPEAKNANLIAYLKGQSETLEL